MHNNTHKAQVKQKGIYMHLVTSLNYVKQNLFQNCYLSSTFVLKLEPNPNLVLESELSLTYGSKGVFMEKKKGPKFTIFQKK
jgi:hypothetical protein